MGMLYRPNFFNCGTHCQFFFFHVYLFTMLPSVSFQKLKFEFAEFEFIEDVKRLFTSLQLAININ